MRYIVGKRGPMKVGDAERQPGEPIPEAAEWPQLHTWVSGGYVVEVPDEGTSTGGGAPLSIGLADVLTFVSTADVDSLNEIADATDIRLEAFADGRAQGVTSPATEATVDTFDITTVNADQAKAWITETTDVAALDAQNEREVQNDKHPGGRVSVTRAIEARIEELQAAGGDQPDADDEGDEE